MFLDHLLSIPAGATHEVREAFQHIREEVTAEFDAMKMRLENLEFRFTGKIEVPAEEAVAQGSIPESTTAFGGMPIGSGSPVFDKTGLVTCDEYEYPHAIVGGIGGCTNPKIVAPVPVGE